MAARARTNGVRIKNPFAAMIPAPISHLISSTASPLLASLLLFSPKTSSPRNYHRYKFFTPSSPAEVATLALFFFYFLVSFTVLGVYMIGLAHTSPQGPPSCSSLTMLQPPSSPVSSPPPPPPSVPTSRILLASISFFTRNVGGGDPGPGMENSVMMPLPVHGVSGNVSKEEREFWEQPDGEGYKPCLDFSIEYRKASARISKEKRRFLVVVASGGLNQQRNQIVDAVVIARILEAALVVPVLQVNLIWGDDSEFPDIFDVEHFKRTLRADVRIVSSLPSTHLLSTQSVENQIPHNVSPFWIRARFYKQLNQEGVLVLKGLDSKLSKNLPPDLQKLRCKVAFHALRFVAPIQELGNRFARRMWIEGQYIALHLRLEKDVWVRSGCLTGLGPEYDNIIAKVRESQTEYITGRLNMSHTQRRLAGLCPLNAFEIARLLKALGAPSSARVFIAGGEPFGGTKALRPLAKEFPNIVTKEMLAREEELEPYTSKSSALAAIDYIVSLSSDVFLPSHGGNMGRVMQGHRAYVGHRKYIKPNKRALTSLLEHSSISDSEFETVVRMLHRKSQGQPQPRTNKRDRDVIAYPVPDCMCKHSKAIC